MMGKIPKSGKSFKGCVEYCMLKKDAVVLDADGLRTGEVTHTIADFNMQRKMRPSLGQAVGHIALNWSPEDAPKLTDELMVKIAKEYLTKMKITGTQVLMVRHHDTNHPHLHLVFNRVNNEGKTISDANQRWNNVKVCKALTLKYGFHMAEGKDRVNRHRLKGADKAKYQLHDQIKAILPTVKSMDELQKQLAKQGISMLYKYKNGTLEVQGISFSKGEYQFSTSNLFSVPGAYSSFSTSAFIFALWTLIASNKVCAFSSLPKYLHLTLSAVISAPSTLSRVCAV